MSSAINKAELISKLKTLEGLNDDERSSLIGLLREHKKYGLVWEDKPEDVEERLREELPVLCEVKDKAILSENPDAPNHILIEGDNLEALTALSYTHEGKIDVIYIDPPYNTGNKDFIYNDSFVDSEDSYRHSKWLSFMNKRLKIAKRLLSDKGVIFISIDDNEQANLKLLCDSIFSPSNFIANIIWEKADSPRMDAKIISSRHDFVIVYAKDITSLPLNKIKINETPEHYNKTDDKGRKYYLKPLRYMGNADRREDRPNMFFPIIAPDGSKIYPYRADGSEGRWRWSEDKVKEDWERIDFVKTKNGWSVYTRLYADNMLDIPVETIWYNKDVESNRQAIATIKQIFGSEKTFTNPKPVKLIQKIALVAGNKKSFILDFFAGSGTTLHATMQLNAEDGGHRQCILVTNNENNICEEVTYERNKRVINGYTTPKGVEVAGLKANTLRYYKTDYISRDRTQRNMRNLVAAATDLLCIKENLYEEQKTFGRFKLKPHLARYFNDGKAHMLIIYREELIDEIVGEIQKLDFGKMCLKIYVFSPSRDPFTDSFFDVMDKVQLVALPAAIYDAYQKVLPKRKEKLFDEEEKEKNVIPTDLFAGQEEGGEA